MSTQACSGKKKLFFPLPHKSWFHLLQTLVFAPVRCFFLAPAMWYPHTTSGFLTDKLHWR